MHKPLVFKDVRYSYDVKSDKRVALVQFASDSEVQFGGEQVPEVQLTISCTPEHAQYLKNQRSVVISVAGMPRDTPDEQPAFSTVVSGPASPSTETPAVQPIAQTGVSTKPKAVPKPKDDGVVRLPDSMKRT